MTHTPTSLAQLEIYRHQASSLLRARAYPEARQLYEKLLENGIVAAATHLGYLYSQTDNPEYDRDKAISHYEISAKNRDTYAQYALGCLLLQAGRRDEALKWFCKGSDLGHDVCSYLAFRELAARGDEKTAQTYFVKALKQGNPAAIQRQSMLKMRGHYGLSAILPGIFQYIRNLPRMVQFVKDNLSPN